MALEWLKAHQMGNGGWNFNHTIGNGHTEPTTGAGSAKSTTGSTAMALLPFLGAGHTHRAGDYKAEVSRGLSYLGKQMKPNGDLRGLETGSNMYSHGLATMAICEAYAMTKDHNLAAPAKSAIAFIATAQDKKGGGWRYTPGSPGDTSVFGWQYTSLKTAKWAGLEVGPNTLGGANNFLLHVSSENGSKYGYTASGGGYSTTAIGLLSRIYMGWTRDNPSLAKGVEYVARVGPRRGKAYYNYYATQLLYQWGGDPWKTWNQEMRDSLVLHAGY